MIGTKKKDMIYLRKDRFRGKNYLIQLYHFLIFFPITKGYLWRVTRRYEILYPGEKKVIWVKSVKFLILLWAVSIVLFALLYLRNPSFYYLCCAIFIIWVANIEITRSSTNGIVLRILKQLDHFLTDIRHFYYLNGAVDESILEAIPFAGKEMKLHGYKIYEVLTSDHMEEELMKYNDSVHNNFLKMFMAQCRSVYDHGDKEVKGESLFLMNIKSLKTDINIAIVKQNKINFLFMGINAMIIIPVLCLNFIREWAVSNIPELHQFYYGRTGMILLVLIFIFTIVLYMMVGYLKDHQPLLKPNYHYLNKIASCIPFCYALDNYHKKNYGKIKSLEQTMKKMGEVITPKQLMVKRWLFGIGTFLASIAFFLILHEIHKEQIISSYQVEAMDQWATTPKEIALIEAVIQEIGQEGIKEKESNLTWVINSLEESIPLKEETILEIAEEIHGMISEYHTSYLGWYEVLIAILMSYLGYSFPYIMIKFKQGIMKMNMQDEVIEFQSIILMLMYMDRMTVTKVLEFMEAFSVIFKDGIRACINEMDSGDMEALLRLKEKETFQPFQRLIDNFLISDKIGLEKGFDEIAVDRVNCTEQRKLDQEINLTNRSTLAKYLAYFHFILVILCYLTIPFMIECLRQFQLYNDTMGQIL